ncbi:hypothetical protein LOCC1_G007760 [Lachnellula occidentalis]|uniref:F-box domain-containing protein n=1 Tax=Lachnellula occidentalis TaxID=215460 RepID=A0A8H8RPI6_9HELO|nr:hypothetical protein LOCC1_G007760 [Lachnellula occidentalis]
MSPHLSLIPIHPAKSAAMTTTGTGGARTISDLPDEILISILSMLPAQRDQCAMCLVSRRINKVADPVLYKNILFDQPHHHLTFSESLLTRPRRGSLIESIRVDYPSSELFDFMHVHHSPISNRIVDPFSRTISTMSNLEHLTVSVPQSLCKGIGALFDGPFDLACLKSCELFYQCDDGGYWDLQDNIQVFSHPTLESLTIRRARLDERGFDSLEKPSETELKELHLIECDINDDALSDILLHPEALKEISITQLDKPHPPLEESPEYIEDYIIALPQHSLESIIIDFPSLRGKSALRMREFEELRTLELRDYQLFGQGSPRLHSVGFPPRLEMLTFLNRVGQDEEIAELLAYTIENKMIVARSLQYMLVANEEHDLPEVIKEACSKTGFELQFG